MVKVASHGLAQAKEIYQDRSQRVRELKAEGRKVLGYLCLYPVQEMMTALDLVPYRIFGDMREPITSANTYLPTSVCPFLRSLLDIGLKGRYDFLDGAAFAHSCDIAVRIPNIWRYTIETPYTHFINTPHIILQSAQELHKELLKDYQKSLEEFVGKKITPPKLREAIKVHNEQRALVRELYDLRKPDPPLISGTELVQIIVALQSLPVEEGSKLVREVIDEVKARKDGPAKKLVRLLLWGPIIHDTAFIEMIESLDANIVMDDTCVGSRAYFADVKLTDNPLDGLGYHYLVDLKCPRTFRETVFGATRKDYLADLETRFGYLGDYAKDWKANGVVLQTMRYCDSHGYEVPALKDYLEHIGLPTVALEQDYSEAALAPMRTRVQGLIELIG